jgi:hypothetical protein
MEQPTIRDAVAVFDNAERLENAVSELQSNGIDRSELSLVAHASHTGRMPGIFGRPPTIRPHSANRLSAIPSCGRDGCLVLDSRRPSQQRLWREAASSPPARYSAANWLTIRDRSSMRNSPTAAYSCGYAHTMRLANETCPTCCGGIQRRCTSTICRLKLLR